MPGFFAAEAENFAVQRLPHGMRHGIIERYALWAHQSDLTD